MTDRELLELAAKAAGIKLYVWNDFNGVEHYASLDAKPYGAIWNPLKDDGDALRLAVKLGLEIKVDLCDDATRANECDCEFLVDHKHFDGGAEAATRRAIVRAAAEIGKAMP